MSKLNLFNKPIEMETFDSWIKGLDDIAKVSVLAIPVVLYGQGGVLFKTLNITLLAVGSYTLLLVSRNLRQAKLEQKRKGE